MTRALCAPQFTKAITIFTLPAAGLVVRKLRFVEMVAVFWAKTVPDKSAKSAPRLAENPTFSHYLVFGEGGCYFGGRALDHGGSAARGQMLLLTHPEVSTSSQRKYDAGTMRHAKSVFPHASPCA